MPWTMLLNRRYRPGYLLGNKLKFSLSCNVFEFLASSIEEISGSNGIDLTSFGLVVCI